MLTTNQSQSSMPTHAMSKNADSLAIDLFKILEYGLWQFGCDVAVHLISLRPRLFSGINIESCAAAEVVGVVFALDLETT